jgi:hypothetical protein
MKRSLAFWAIGILLMLTGWLTTGHMSACEAAEFDDGPGIVVVEKDRNVLNWTQNYIESIGIGIPPKNMKGAQAKAMAKRAAIVDLQRNLLEFVKGVQIDGRTTMENFIADDFVNQRVTGMIKNVQLVDGEWDGESYTMSGRLELPQIRVLISSAPAFEPVRPPKPVEPPRKSGARYTGLIIDVRHLPLIPSMTFNVLDGSGSVVYGMSFVNQENYLQSGLCAYYTNINYAKGEVHVASNPIVVKAAKLSPGNVDIVISNGDASKVRSSTYDFRRECKVIVVCK